MRNMSELWLNKTSGFPAIKGNHHKAGGEQNKVSKQLVPVTPLGDTPRKLKASLSRFTASVRKVLLNYQP